MRSSPEIISTNIKIAFAMLGRSMENLQSLSRKRRQQFRGIKNQNFDYSSNVTTTVNADRNSICVGDPALTKEFLLCMALTIFGTYSNAKNIVCV